MIFGPVLPFELLTSSRRARYFVVRVVYGVVLLATLWVHYESTVGSNQSAMTPQAAARFAAQFFYSLSIVQILAVLVLTPAMVAGTIAEEKDRRTIEYLLVSDLRNREIVLGKLAARLLHLLALIAVGLPVLALTMLLGGVSMEEVSAVFAVSASTLLTAAALSIVVSVHARRAREAVVGVFALGMILLLFPWLCSMMLPLAWPSLAYFLGPVLDPIRAMNPIGYLLSQFFASQGVDWTSIGELLRNQGVLAIACGGVAVWRVRAVYIRQTEGQAPRRRRATWRWWKMPLGDSPMIWKELFAEQSSAGRSILVAIAHAVLFLAVLIPTLWLFFQMHNPTSAWSMKRDDFREYLMVIATAVTCLGILVVAVRSATSISSERERQTWDVLLATPLEAGEIVRAKLWGSLYAMRGLMLLVVILWILGVAAGSVVPLIVPVLAAEVALLSGFAGMLGLVFSIHLKSSQRAMAATASVLVFLGGGYLFCCIPMINGAGSGSEVVLAGCIPVLLGLPLAVDPDRVRPLSDDEAGLVAAWVLGNIGYTVAILILWASALSDFDLQVGRRPTRAP